MSAAKWRPFCLGLNVLMISQDTGFQLPGIQGWPVNSPHKWPVTRKMFPFDDVIMTIICCGFPSLEGAFELIMKQFF